MRYFKERDPEFWTRANIFIIAILVEHAVIGIKIVIAMIIPDLPFSVTQAEMKREKQFEQANRELLEIKVKGNQESFQDMQERLQREAASAQAAMIDEMDDLANEGDDLEDDEEALRQKELRAKKRA